MKKLPIVLCLMLLSIALFNSRSYAAFLYDIDMFEQYNGTSTFTDSFDDNDVEPVTGSEYNVEANFASDAQDPSDGGWLDLDSNDGIGPIGQREVWVAVSNPTYYFSDSAVGSVKGRFGYAIHPNSYFGIDIWNSIAGFEDAATEDGVFMGVATNLDGTPIAVWGDETQFMPLGFSTIGETIENVTMELEMDIDNNITARWDYTSNGSWDKIVDMSSITDLTLDTNELGEFYTGSFAAAEPLGQPVPEPATIALLGIGLVGLAGAAARRRLWRKTDDR